MTKLTEALEKELRIKTQMMPQLPPTSLAQQFEKNYLVQKKKLN